jgi:hypothetical protein
MSDADRMAEFYQATRGDKSLWSEKPAKAKIRRPGSIVFSVRLSRSELDEVRKRAEADGLTVSEFVRRAALGQAESVTSFLVLPSSEMLGGSSWALWDTGAQTTSGTVPESADPIEVAAGG